MFVHGPGVSRAARELHGFAGSPPDASDQSQEPRWCGTAGAPAERPELTRSTGILGYDPQLTDGARSLVDLD
jgi:hypothetical protein